MKVIKKEYLGQQEVYDIGVSSYTGNHNFFLKNGLVAHNCFNKAHSVSYSFLTYISAYLKAHYPVEFFTALMSTRSKTLQPKSWAVKAPEYIAEAKKFNVEVLPPSVNQSSYEFTINGNEIYFGLNAIRDVGKTAAKAIIKARGTTFFKDIKDFLNRVSLQKVNTKVFEALVKSGAFDKMGYDRATLLEKTPLIYQYIRDVEDYKQREIDYLAREHHNNTVAPLIERRNFLRKEVSKINRRIEKQKQTEEDVSILPSYEEELLQLEEQSLKKLPSLKRFELPIFPELQKQKTIALNFNQIMMQANYIGCYIGGHPMDLIKVNSATLIQDIEEGEYATVAGVILSLKEIKTRAGKFMAFIEISDISSSAEIIAFPATWAKIKNLELKESDIVKVRAKVEQTDPEYKLIINKIEKVITDEMDS